MPHKDLRELFATRLVREMQFDDSEETCQGSLVIDEHSRIAIPFFAGWAPILYSPRAAFALSLAARLWRGTSLSDPQQLIAKDKLQPFLGTISHCGVYYAWISEGDKTGGSIVAQTALLEHEVTRRNVQRRLEHLRDSSLFYVHGILELLSKYGVDRN